MIDPLVFSSGCSNNCEINRSLIISPSGKRGWTKNGNSEGRLNLRQSLTRAKPPAGQSHTRSKGTQGGTPHNGRNRSLGFFFSSRRLSYHASNKTQRCDHSQEKGTRTAALAHSTSLPSAVSSSSTSYCSHPLVVAA